MKTVITRILALFIVFGISAAAIADTARVVWICNVNDGKSIDDVRSANSAWVEFMHANVDESISSMILTPVIGNFESGRFVFADDYPSIAVWNEALQASETDAGEPIMEAINDAATCTNSSLYSAEKS